MGSNCSRGNDEGSGGAARDPLNSETNSQAAKRSRHDSDETTFASSKGTATRNKMADDAEDATQEGKRGPKHLLARAVDSTASGRSSLSCASQTLASSREHGEEDGIIRPT